MEITKRIEELDDIWTKIIDADDHILRLEDAIKAKIESGKWEEAYEIEKTIGKLRLRISDLKSRSSVLERLIMTMLVEE